jgi:putative NADH-flavin reductase
MKKIALFGASGKTGQEFLPQAIEKGYSIKALVRNPEKIKQSSDQLEIIKGDVLNEADVEKTIKECDVVVSLFGHVKGSPEWLQTEGTRNIVRSMEKHGVERIISLSGGGLRYPEKDRPKLPDKLIRGIMKITVPKILRDAEAHREVLQDSKVKWVIARAPMLKDNPKKGQYRVSWVGVDAGTQLGRADLADFVLGLVEDDSYDYQLPFLSY